MAEKYKTVTPSIKWKYFFGGTCGRTFDRYYKAEILGVTVERHGSNKGVEFAIGNIDDAKVKFKKEWDLFLAVSMLINDSKTKLNS
jgi:hypothetical protein